ncbi:MAG TPA: DsbA family oxidoreductase [Steroidobacteraceae bacterium]|jgi:predicted DsbA family dithiol-disulfide isomerase
MPQPIKIDFVSDVSCPWCVIGLKSLEAALTALEGEVLGDIHFQPFELNPDMGPEGEPAIEHIMRKYGSTAEQVARNREMIRARGAELGFVFDMAKRARLYSTFDAHRLLHWAEDTGKQKELKQALFGAYFTDGRNPSDHRVLEELAASVGLDRERARQILASDEYATEVRAREQLYLSSGIHAVPAVILNNRYLVQGGQPVEVFERALREAATAA